MAELSKIRKNGVDYDIKDATARKEIAALKENGNGNNSGGNADYTVDYDRFYDSIARMQVNPTEPLNIVTYDGSNKPTHPKVLYFENGWAGHKYWLTYSPFPGNSNAEENPCIAYSEDGVNFSSEGISNPIEDMPMENGAKVGYNSDPHLVMVNGVMECWWRTHFQSGTNANHEVIFRKTSTDGINWSAKEELFRVQDASAGSCLSPSVIFEDGVYKIWTVYKQQVMRYYESTTGANWTPIRDINVDNPDYPIYKIWHIDVIHTENGYEFVGCYHPTNDYNDNRYIYYAVSDNNITYSDRILILTPGKAGNFDATELYRPSILRLSNKVRVYYGCRNGYGNWKIGMIEAPNPYLFNSILKNGMRFDDLESRISVLESGSGGPVVLTAITANYTGGDVLAGTPVEDLTGIVVTAMYSDGSSNTVTGYTLSGTIAEGENTVTVTFGGKTATFTVVGVAIPVPCTGISLDKTEIAFDGKETQTITATITPSNTTDPVVWVSTDPAVADISVFGNMCTVHSKKNGEAIVNVTCGDYRASCNISVSGFVKSANIMEGVSWHYGTFNGDTGAAITAKDEIMSSLFDITEYAGESMFVQVDKVAGWTKFGYYDIDGEFISSSYANGNRFEAEVPATAVMAKIGMRATSTKCLIATKELPDVNFADLPENVGKYYSPDDGSIKLDSRYNSRMVTLGNFPGIFATGVVSCAFYDADDNFADSFHSNNTEKNVFFTANATKVGVNYKVEDTPIVGEVVGWADVTEILE